MCVYLVVMYKTSYESWESFALWHYSDVIISTIACQITSRTIVYSTVYWGADQRKHQSCASLDFVRGIRRWPVNSPHKKPVTQVDITHILVDYPHWIPTVEHGSYFELIMMTSSNGNIFRVTGPLCGEVTGHRWIPCTKASNAELWCFLWSALE